MATNSTNPITDQLPVVLIHKRLFDIPTLKHQLNPHFHIIDPSSSPDYNPETPLQSSSDLHRVKALLTIGPAPTTFEFLNALPSLEILVSASAGVDHVDLEECKRRGIKVTNASEAMADEVADYAVGLLIDVLRRISAADRYVRGGLWPVTGEYPLASKIAGKRVGIVGFGKIGSEVTNRLVPFGCSIAYNSRTKKPSVPFQYYANVVDLAVNSDILILCCSLTDETQHMINKDVMEALGKEGVVINVARGAIIDEKEFVQFLVQGKIGGAGLDVFEDEPNVPTELFSLDNVVLSPHIAVVTPESVQAVQELTVANLKAYFSNQPLRSLVRIDR